jgi:hypothetical protein
MGVLFGNAPDSAVFRSQLPGCGSNVCSWFCTYPCVQGLIQHLIFDFVLSPLLCLGVQNPTQHFLREYLRSCVVSPNVRCDYAAFSPWEFSIVARCSLQ